MAPWSRSRAEKASERDLKQKAKVQDVQPDKTTSSNAIEAFDGAANSILDPPQRSRRGRDSVVSMSAVPVMSEPNPHSLEIPGNSNRGGQTKRFSLLKFRHASDSQLSKTAREQAADVPAVPFDPPPTIIATAPTFDTVASSKRRSTMLFKKTDGRTHTLFSPNPDNGIATGMHGDATNSTPAPPPYSDASTSAMALPVNRASESDASSSADPGVFATTTTTTHTVSTTTTFFKLPRRKKDKGPLFPLPPKPISTNTSLAGTPRISAAGSGTNSPRHYFGEHPEQSLNGDSPRKPRFPGVGSSNRSASRGSQRSARASSSLAHGSAIDLRGRFSTTTSSGKRGFLEEDWNAPTPPIPQSTRTSTSTAGRPSLAGLFHLNRGRQSSEPLGRNSNGGPDTPVSMDSRHEKIPAVVIPPRQEGDTAAKYLARLEEVVHRSALVAIISKTDDEFMKNVLRSFMRRFSFFEDPLDMAVRKLLMHIDLPKETQHIDRTLQAFADRYHECNPGVFPDADHAYFCAFSIVILHTDAFNKNNKRKMQKSDYVKNAREQSGVSQEVLECFYDNIIYTPFIHLEDDVTIPKQHLPKHGKKGIKAPATPLKKHSGPIDPYTVILDGKLDTLRPDLLEILSMEDPFNCTGTVPRINVAELNRSFMRYGVLQVLSSRSRPAAFMTQATITNPAEASMGVVDMTITKAGILWRKDTKKKKTRSPWQEWGAVLTPVQLCLFRNTSWVKNLMHQHETHTKVGKQTSCVFKPPIEQFRPDFSLSMDEVVALVDSEYKKHKNAFVFTKSSASFAEVFLADNELELDDWIAKINFAAAYRTAGIRMRATIEAESQSHAARTSLSRPTSATQSEFTMILKQSHLQKDRTLEGQVMQLRTQLIDSKLKDALQRREALEKNLQTMLRLSRQMCVLTPIQNKTRELVVEGTAKLATNIRWTRMEYWRVGCHHDILQADLDLDKPSTDGAVDEDKPTELVPQSAKDEKSRSAFARLGSRAGSTAKEAAAKIRPSQQLSGRQLFSMDDIFRSPSRTRQSHHKAKASWELPPLSFDRGRSVSSSRAASRRSSEVILDRRSTGRSDSVPAKPGSSHSDSQNANNPAITEPSIVSPSISTNDIDDDKAEAAEEEKAKVPELDEKEPSKVRHSFHSKLQKVHVPTPTRSKKHRDSTNSSVISDDAMSADGSEGLARGPGKFTVHGKKASVITFDADWSGSNAEEKMKARISQHEDDLGSASNDSTPMRAKKQDWIKSRSSSYSTVRDDSNEFVTPTEGEFPVDDQAPETPRRVVDEDTQDNDTPKLTGFKEVADVN